MKKFLLIIISGLFIFTAAQAEIYYGATNIKQAELGDVTVHGAANMQNVRAQSLLVLGSLDFKNLDVFKTAEVIGNLKSSGEGRFGILKVTGETSLRNSIMNSLQVIGPLNAAYITVKGNTIVVGSLTAGSSQFDNITVTANKISLNDVKVTNIYIKKSPNEKEQIVDLAGSTLVGGNITFEEGDGIVIARPGVSIIGEVKGGRLTKNK